MERSTSNKRLLHKEIRDNMSVLEQEVASENITQNVLALLESDFKGANIFLCFYPFGSEVDLLPLYKELLEDSKKLYFPISVVVDNSLDFRRINNLENDFSEGFHGIMEPRDDCESLYIAGEQIICITPGLVFDRNFNRMGYGGGFYDRFFAKHPEIIRIAPIFNHQLEDEITVSSHDLPMDYIVTENETLKGDRL